MQVKDIMTKDISFVSSQSTVVEAAKLMKDENIGSVPVVDNNMLVGILTDRDIVTREIASGKNPVNQKISDVMSTGVATVASSTDIHDAAKVMADKQIRRLPVVDSGKLVGMLSIGDLAIRDNFEDEAGEALSDISIPNHTLY